MKDPRYYINSVRKIWISIITMIILFWAFFKNAFWGKVIISPFFICTLSVFCENLFLLLNKKKIANIFKYIFRITFFCYYFGFLIFVVYYAMTNKSYLLLIMAFIFLIFGINFLKRVLNIKNIDNQKLNKFDKNH